MVTCGRPKTRDQKHDIDTVNPKALQKMFKVWILLPYGTVDGGGWMKKKIIEDVFAGMGGKDGKRLKGSVNGIAQVVYFCALHYSIFSRL